MPAIFTVIAEAVAIAVALIAGVAPARRAAALKRGSRVALRMIVDKHNALLLDRTIT